MFGIKRFHCTNLCKLLQLFSAMPLAGDRRRRLKRVGTGLRKFRNIHNCKKLLNIKNVRRSYMFILLGILFQSCTPNQLKDKLYFNSNASGTTYWYFKTDNNYREIFVDGDYVEITNGNYIYKKGELTFGNFKLHDSDLIDIYSGQTQINATVQVIENHIKMAYDLSNSDFCKKNINELPANIQQMLMK